MLRDYEILYIVRPDVEETDLEGVTKTVETLIDNLDGKVQSTNVWGKRRLAYEVAHRREGHYVLTDFQIDPGRVPEMEATLKISDQVFRHLIVRKPEPKAAAPTGRRAGGGADAAAAKGAGTDTAAAEKPAAAKEAAKEAAEEPAGAGAPGAAADVSAAPLAGGVDEETAAGTSAGSPAGEAGAVVTEEE